MKDAKFGLLQAKLTQASFISKIGSFNSSRMVNSFLEYFLALTIKQMESPNAVMDTNENMNNIKFELSILLSARKDVIFERIAMQNI